MTQQEFNQFIKDQGLTWEYTGKEVTNGEGWFGPGWYDITARLITDLIELGWDKTITQVKEKFGGGRFYIGGASTAIFDRIVKWEEETYRTCEDCGTTDNVTTMGPAPGWVRTLCNDCRNSTGAEIGRGKEL